MILQVSASAPSLATSTSLSRCPVSRWSWLPSFMGLPWPRLPKIGGEKSCWGGWSKIEKNKKNLVEPSKKESDPGCFLNKFEGFFWGGWVKLYKNKTKKGQFIHDVKWKNACQIHTTRLGPQTHQQSGGLGPWYGKNSETPKLLNVFSEFFIRKKLSALLGCLKLVWNTVDGSEIRRSPVEVGSLSNYLQGFIHPKWLFGISSINSTTTWGVSSRQVGCLPS